MNNSPFRAVRLFVKNLPLIILCILSFLGIAYIFLSKTDNFFESNAEIHLADIQEQGKSIGNNGLRNFVVFSGKSNIEVEKQLLRSDLLINKVVDSLNLDVSISPLNTTDEENEAYLESPFTIRKVVSGSAGSSQICRTSLIDEKSYYFFPENTEDIKEKRNFGDTINLGGMRFAIIPNQKMLVNALNRNMHEEYHIKFSPKEELVKDIKERMVVSYSGNDASILRIEFRDKNPYKAADFVNTMANLYIKNRVESKSGVAATTVDFLNDRLDTIGKYLKSAEENLEAYKLQQGIVNLNQETETNMRRVARLELQKTNIGMELQATNRLNQYMNHSSSNLLDLAPNFQAHSDLLSTEIVKKIKVLQSQRKDLLIDFTPEYEEVKVIDDKLNMLNSYLKEGIRNTQKAQSIKYNRVNSDIQKVKGSFGGLATKEKTLRRLERDFYLLDETYKALHQKKVEAEVAEASSISFDKIITNGKVSEDPVSPNKKLTFFLAGFIGFILSSLGVFAYYDIRKPLLEANLIEQQSFVPLLTLSSKSDNESYKKLLAHLSMKNHLKRGSIVNFQSYHSTTEQTNRVLGLANYLTNKGYKVLLVNTTSDYIDSLQNSCAIIQREDIEGFIYEREKLSDAIVDWQKDFDVILINNEFIRDNFTSLIWTVFSTCNLFYLRECSSSIYDVRKLEDIATKYKVAWPYFIFEHRKKAKLKSRYLSGFSKSVASLGNIFSKKQKTTYHGHQEYSY